MATVQERQEAPEAAEEVRGSETAGVMITDSANCIRMLFKAGRRTCETREGGTGRQPRALGPVPALWVLLEGNPTKEAKIGFTERYWLTE